MPSQTFYCPHCKRQLTKSAQAYVLGEAIEQKSTFIGFGEIPPDVTCPGCGNRIDAMKMIKGGYDLDHITQKYSWLYMLGIFGAPFIFKFVFHWSWVASVFVGIFAGAIAAQIIVEVIKLSDSKRI